MFKSAIFCKKELMGELNFTNTCLEKIVAYNNGLCRGEHSKGIKKAHI